MKLEVLETVVTGGSGKFTRQRYPEFIVNFELVSGQ